MELLTTSGTTFSGSDWKYGWPHKVYINGMSFYTEHFRFAKDQVALDKLLIRCFGLSFMVDDDKGLAYMSASDGYQAYGIIGADGNPDFSKMRELPGKIHADTGWT